MKIRLFSFLMALALVLVLAVPALAAPPANPGKAPADLDRIVFVHYKKDARPAGQPNNVKKLYSYSGYRWATASLPVQYWYNPAGSPVATAEAGVVASFQTWEDDPFSSIAYAFQGTTAVAPGVKASFPDYRNVVGWADLSAIYPNAIAVTIIWSQRGTKLVSDVDTAFNTSGLAWVQADISTDPNTTQLPDTAGYDADVQAIMTHEAGHWLVLNDLYNGSASEQTMYGYAADRELKKRSLEAGDIAGVRKAYPGS